MLNQPQGFPLRLRKHAQSCLQRLAKDMFRWRYTSTAQRLVIKQCQLAHGLAQSLVGLLRPELADNVPRLWDDPGKAWRRLLVTAPQTRHVLFSSLALRTSFFSSKMTRSLNLLKSGKAISLLKKWWIPKKSVSLKFKYRRWEISTLYCLWTIKLLYSLPEFYPIK